MEHNIRLGNVRAGNIKAWNVREEHIMIRIVWEGKLNKIILLYIARICLPTQNAATQRNQSVNNTSGNILLRKVINLNGVSKRPTPSYHLVVFGTSVHNFPITIIPYYSLGRYYKIILSWRSNFVRKIKFFSGIIFLRFYFP